MDKEYLDNIIGSPYVNEEGLSRLQNKSSYGIDFRDKQPITNVNKPTRFKELAKSQST